MKSRFTAFFLQLASCGSLSFVISEEIVAFALSKTKGPSDISSKSDCEGLDGSLSMD